MASYDFDFSTGINVGLGRPRGIDMGSLFDPGGPYGYQSVNSTVSDEANNGAETSQTGDTADIDAGTRQFEGLIRFMYGPEGQNYLKAKSRIMLDQQKEQMREAGKYKALFETPEKIASAFTIPAAIAAQGQVNAANAYAAGALKSADIYSNFRPAPISVGNTLYNFG